MGSGGVCNRIWEGEGRGHNEMPNVLANEGCVCP